MGVRWWNVALQDSFFENAEDFISVAFARTIFRSQFLKLGPVNVIDADFAANSFTGVLFWVGIAKICPTVECMGI
jgi:hypothetical protein